MSQELHNAILNNDKQRAIQLIQAGLYDQDKDTRSTILITASEKGMTDIVQLLLEKGVVNQDNINFQDRHGETALYHACCYRYNEIAKILIEHGATNTPNKNGYTPLCKASEKGMADVVQLLFEKGVVNQDSAGNTALYWACYFGNNEIARILAEHGATNTPNNRGNTPLHMASQSGMIDIVQLLFEKGVVKQDNINLKDSDGATALYLACHYGYNEIAKILIEHGATNTPDTRGYTPLHEASKKGMTDVVQLLLEKGVVNQDNINLKDRHGETALYWACYYRDSKIAKILIEHGAMNTPKNNGCTPLHKASENSMTDVVQLLLEKGVVNQDNINFQNRYGETALYQACYFYNNEIAKILAEHGATNTPNNCGNTPLHEASRKGITDIVQLLFEKGVINQDNINLKDSYGATALYLACYFYNNEIAKILAEHGATNTPDTRGYTPLHDASKKGMTDIVQLLLEKGVVKQENINFQDSDGETALYLACRSGKNEIAKILIEHGATNTPNNRGETPLHGASQNGMADVVQLLFEKGAVKQENINFQDIDGNTALYLACRHRHNEIAKILIEHGATNTPNKNGCTPLYRASEAGMTDVVKLMCNKGIVNVDNINIRNNFGETALYIVESVQDGVEQDSLNTETSTVQQDLNPTVNKFAYNACSKQHDKIAKMLIECGADISDAQLDNYPLIKTIRDYQKIGATIDDSAKCWLALTNKMVILSSSYDKMKEFVSERPSLQKYLFKGIDLNIALDMFNGNWQDFFKQCYTNSIDVSEIASNINIPTIVLSNALLYGVHWENVEQDSHMVQNFVNMLICNPQLLKDGRVSQILHNDYDSVLYICAMYIESLIVTNDPKGLEVFLSLDMIHPELWDVHHDKFEDTKYFSREKYHTAVSKSQVLCNWSHGKSEVELGKIGDKTIIIPIESTTDSHAVWLFLKAIAKKTYGDSVDINAITKEAVKDHDANVLKILKASGFDIPIDEITNDAVKNHDSHMLKILKASGFDMPIDKIINEAVENHDQNTLKLLYTSGFDVPIGCLGEAVEQL